LILGLWRVDSERFEVHHHQVVEMMGFIGRDGGWRGPGNGVGGDAHCVVFTLQTVCSSEMMESFHHMMMIIII
jgi:hypothetical protein